LHAPEIGGGGAMRCRMQERLALSFERAAGLSTNSVGANSR
jgi:hypothetical protein